nr:hypothetical protein [Ruminococcus sp. 1001713B170207_170306_F5]
MAKLAKGCQPGRNPGCLQGSKVEGDRVGRRQYRQVYSTKTTRQRIGDYNPGKSTQQVNKITFVPMNDKKVIKLTYGYWK